MTPGPLVDHATDGAIRYFLATEAPVPATHRPIETRAEAVPEISPAGFFAIAACCLSCSAKWAGVGPAAADFRTLECFACGEHRSAQVFNVWCSTCGYDGRVAFEAAPPTTMQTTCPKCTAPGALLETP